MATNTHKTVWELEHKQYLKRLKEIAKAEKEVTDASSKALKAGNKDQGKSLKAYEDAQKRKLGLHSKHDKAMKAANAFQLKSNKTEMAFLQGVEKHKEKAHKTGLSRFRQQMSEFKRSPVGKFMTSPGRAGSWAKGGARAGASLMGGAAGMLVGASVAGYGRYMQYQQSLAGMSGMASGSTVRRGMRRRMGAGLGFNLVESAQQGAQMGRATGVTGPRELQQAMRATGMGAGEVGGIYGALARGGTSFEGAGGDSAGVRRGQSAGGREMQRMISAGMQSGLKRGRLHEFTSGVTKLMGQQQRFQVSKVGSGDFSKTLAMFGQTGLPGMQGKAGADLLSQLGQGIRQPGGGESGKALMMQAMGFGKPGGSVGFYEAEKKRERGATGENVMSVMSEVQKQFGGGQEAALAMRESLGVSLDQAETLLKIYDSNESAEEKRKKVEEEMEKSKTLEQESRDYLKTTAAGAARLAARFDESVTHGAKAAKFIEKVEDWQYKLVALMFQAVEYLQKIWDMASMYTEAYAAGESGPTVMAARRAAMAEQEKVMGKTTALERAAGYGLSIKHASIAMRGTKTSLGVDIASTLRGDPGKWKDDADYGSAKSAEEELAGTIVGGEHAARLRAAFPDMPEREVQIKARKLKDRARARLSKGALEHEAKVAAEKTRMRRFSEGGVGTGSISTRGNSVKGPEKYKPSRERALDMARDILEEGRGEIAGGSLMNQVNELKVIIMNEDSGQSNPGKTKVKPKRAQPKGSTGTGASGV